MEKILILDRDPAVCETLERQLKELDYEVASAPDAQTAQDGLSQGRFEVVLAEVAEGEGTVQELVGHLRSSLARPLVILVADPEVAGRALRGLDAGAFDVLVKPVSGISLEVAFRRAENHLRLLKIIQWSGAGTGPDGNEVLLGPSAAMQSVRQLVRKVAQTEVSVLIHGESGSGKSLVARELYRQGSRSRGSWVEFDCAAWPASRVEAELFGGESTARDGGVIQREGVIELAHGGTLLLGEVGELPGPAQSRLLQFLKTREIQRVGGTRRVRADVRLVATTNRQLEEKVKRGEFNEELLFRLNIVPVIVPPLRQRKEDIPVLVDFFRQRAVRRHGVEVLAISPAGLRCLHDYNWPGNVRELRELVDQALTRCEEGTVLEPQHLGLAGKGSGSGSGFSGVGSETPETLHDVEKKQIFLVLDQCRGNRTHAAKRLGISIRTLRNKLREYREQAQSESGVLEGAGLVGLG